MAIKIKCLLPCSQCHEPVRRARTVMDDQGNLYCKSQCRRLAIRRHRKAAKRLARTLA